MSEKDLQKNLDFGDSNSLFSFVIENIKKVLTGE